MSGEPTDGAQAHTQSGRCAAILPEARTLVHSCQEQGALCGGRGVKARTSVPSGRAVLNLRGPEHTALGRSVRECEGDGGPGGRLFRLRMSSTLSLCPTVSFPRTRMHLRWPSDPLSSLRCNAERLRVCGEDIMRLPCPWPLVAQPQDFEEVRK